MLSPVTVIGELLPVAVMRCAVSMPHAAQYLTRVPLPIEAGVKDTVALPLPAMAEAFVGGVGGVPAASTKSNLKP